MEPRKIQIQVPTGLVNFVQSVLANRNTDITEMYRKLNSLQAPQEMRDAVKAALRIIEAIKAGHKIVLYGDYDADGCGCIVIAKLLFKALGYDNFDTFHNDRWLGFGMNKQGIDSILASNPDVKLIVTADNGIVAFDAVDYANSLGIDVVITDHHIPDASGRLPNAVAVVDPHREDETCEYRDLCGTGVLFKVMALVFHYLGRDVNEVNNVLDFVAVATVGDVVPITGENRVLVKYGLELINSGKVRPEIWNSFLKESSTFGQVTECDAKNIAFFIAPCVNACSRMSGNLKEPLKAFTELPPEEVPEAIGHLVDVNNVRKVIMNTRVQEGMTQLKDSNAKCIVVAMEHCEEGIVGLVAGNICTNLYRPTLVLSRDEHGNWKGSGRSIPGIHVKEALDVINETHPGILLAYGGHSQACGLTVLDGKVDELRDALNEYVEKNFSEDTFIQKVVVDYIIEDPAELPKLYADKRSLEPFGCEFPEPVVMVRFKPDEARTLKDGLHLKFRWKNITMFSWKSGYHLNGHKVDDIEEVIAVCSITDGDTLNCSPELLQLRFKN